TRRRRTPPPAARGPAPTAPADACRAAGSGRPSARTGAAAAGRRAGPGRASAWVGTLRRRPPVALLLQPWEKRNTRPMATTWAGEQQHAAADARGRTPPSAPGGARGPRG